MTNEELQAKVERLEKAICEIKSIMSEVVERTYQEVEDGKEKWWTKERISHIGNEE